MNAVALTLRDLGATLRTIGLNPLPAERATVCAREIIARRDAYREALAARAIVRSLRHGIKIEGRWHACQTDAGAYGDMYCGLNLLDALDLAREAWREAIAGLNRRGL